MRIPESTILQSIPNRIYNDTEFPLLPTGGGKGECVRVVFVTKPI